MLPKVLSLLLKEKNRLRGWEMKISASTVFTNELKFDDSGEIIRISLSYENISPEDIKLSQVFVDTMWNELKSEIFSL